MSTYVGVADDEEQATLAEAVAKALSKNWSPEQRYQEVNAPGSLSERPIWGVLADLGVAGLPVPEADGGSGGRWIDLAVALEILGGGLAPAPAVSSAGALGALEVLQGELSASLRTNLAAGTSLAAVSWTGAEETIRPTAERAAPGMRVTGTLESVLTPEADLLLILADTAGTAGEPVLVVVPTDGAGVTLTRLEGLDPTRPVADVTLADAQGTVLAQGAEALSAARRGRAAAAAALASEMVGATGHCLGAAVAYAADRQQFGKPIGSFQAVKHRCADILASLEIARAAARHVAELLDADTDADALDEAAAIALLRTADALHEASTGYIQILGGIGFTWEHEAHLYFRRAGGCAALFGGASAHRRRLDPTAASGRRSTAIVSGPAAELDARVRELLPGHREKWGTDDSFPARLDWQRTLHAVGWIAPQWPVEFGGRGLGIADQVACERLLAAHRAPSLAGILGVNNVGPTLMRFGTSEQQRHIAAIQAGTETWCQGFSEPGAGSDLAALRTRAVLQGTPGEQEFVITGQKIWTSDGMAADYVMLLVRTDPEAPPHKGISALLVPMRLPGITRRPITQITGEGGFAELFFDDVRVPYSALLGTLHEGWRVTMTTLAFERAGVIVMAGEVEQDVEDLVTEVADRELDPETRLALTERLVEARLLGLLGRRALRRIADGAAPGPEHSVIKLAHSLVAQRLGETHLAALGIDGIASPRGAAARHAYLRSRAATIAAGTTEIMRNILAERVLGMPR